jgi:hypothetical protein
VLGGGSVTVSSGSTDTATTLNGGTETVSNGGSAASGTVLNGGYEHVLSGGHLLTSETIGSGGTLEFAGGAVSSGATIVFSGTSGTVAFDSGTSATTPITGFQAGDQIAFASGVFSSPITSAGLLMSGGHLELSVAGGGQTFLIPNISFASGYVSGAQLINDLAFAVDTATVNGSSYTAVTVGDNDSGEQAALQLNIPDMLVGSASETAVPFTIAGLDPEDTGTVTFTDQNNSAVTVTFSAGQTSGTANLTGLADGAISTVLRVNTVLVGNSFTPVSGATITLDTSTPTVSIGNAGGLTGSASQTISGTVSVRRTVRARRSAAR